MRDGGEPAVIERWKELVKAVPEARQRGDLMEIALVFAELIPELVNWQRHLEGWEVRESQYLKSFEAKGEVHGRRAFLLEGLRLKLGSPVPEPIRLAIEGTNDLNTIERWFQTGWPLESSG